MILIIAFLVVKKFRTDYSSEFVNGVNSTNASVAKDQNGELLGLSYSKVKKIILDDGWMPIKRSEQFSNDPALQYCYEDTCTSYFGKQDKVKIVVYSICNVNRYIECPGKPEGFERVEKVSLENKNSAEKQYKKIMAHYFGD